MITKREFNMAVHEISRDQERAKRLACDLRDALLELVTWHERCEACPEPQTVQDIEDIVTEANRLGYRLTFQPK
jgi:hypothetical protein